MEESKQSGQPFCLFVASVQLKQALHAWLEKVGDADPIATERSQLKAPHGKK